MSEERALLKEFIDFVDSYEFYPTERNIIWEIVSRTQELLAQPEQTEQDAKDKFQDLATYGVSFSKGGQRTDPRDVYISTEQEQEPVGIVRIIGGYPDNSERVVDWVRPYKYLKDGDRLYTAPQKREPLGLEIMDFCGSEDYREGFKDGALYSEKHHGIGGNNDN